MGSCLRPLIGDGQDTLEIGIKSFIRFDDRNDDEGQAVQRSGRYPKKFEWVCQVGEGKEICI